ncbi:MAG TPA: prephenate dehydrogenase/arogenate dehydrogenase family protein [Kiritimatiellia bacterium]|nr:prephenate dehydrogenase/arogenate dehydrogenase family protein [Kiritimatiellia bacterium]
MGDGAVTLVGLGLMGGSLGLALRQRGGVEVRGATRSPETARKALAAGAVDRMFEDAGSAVEGADVVVFCAPILTIPRLVERCRMRLEEGALLTDVGSTKLTLHEEVSGILGAGPGVFIGSHPICGSEQAGIDAARADLYRDAVVVLTPGEGAHEEDVGRLRGFWESVGGKVHITTPERHDRLLARSSHLPHMVASLLARVAGREDDLEDVGKFCGTGFRDTSRVAEGSPEIWMDILISNREAVLEELKIYGQAVGELVEMLEQKQFDGIHRMLHEGQASRKRLMAYGKSNET